MDLFEEEKYGWTSPVYHMIAGSAAGVAEHCAIFPLDTIKTHLQSQKPIHNSFPHIARSIVQTHGISGLFRGVSAAALGAIPSHALHFTSYEFCKHILGGDKPGHHPFAIATSGAISTVISEATMTPCDSIKQKLQLNRYPSLVSCVRGTYKEYGVVRGFFAGFVTALTINAPYVAVQFATYESLKTVLAGEGKEEREKTIHHLLAGLGGGALAGAVTNPLDVGRTRLQTQTSDVPYQGMVNTMKRIYGEEGVTGLSRGIGTRMAFHSLSSAATWTTYEFLKHMLQDKRA